MKKQNFWRMSFRCGNQGPSMWPKCFDLGIAAMTYGPIENIDISKLSKTEYIKILKRLNTTQQPSLNNFYNEINVGDIIYVKNGPNIVGKGKVLSTYKFSNKSRLVCPDSNTKWKHHRKIIWDKTFLPIYNLKLGDEQPLLLELNIGKVKLIENKQELLQKPNDYSAEEGERVKRTIFFIKRNRAIIQIKKQESDGKCELCKFEFSKYYKLTTKDCLEVHHKNPISEYKGLRVTKLSNLIIICPNCHSLIHSKNPAISYEDMKAKHIKRKL
ncbi:MAG: HNH endonuclease [Ignavibacteria bacterium]